ncbi:MAG: ankyrin repeat domain-containing protein [Gammaproteobacteria bacterium]|nr:ankyrin repeat domain-containing protein [Gammaproteobacteria bacterium]
MFKKDYVLGVLLLASCLLPLASAFGQDGSEAQLLALVSAGETAAALELIGRSTDVNQSQPDGTTALHWAVYYADEALVRQLIRRGAQVTARNEFGATPLSQAAIIGNPGIIDRLLDAGADANEAGADGQTPLMVIARSGNIEAAETLVNADADVNVVEKWRGQTALMWAAAQQQPEMVAFLLANGADPDAQSFPNNWERQVTAEPRMKVLPAGGLTPLLYAAREGCSECTRLLIEAGADINKTDPESITPLLMANLNANWDSAKLLIEAGAWLDKWDFYGRNPLYAAVDYSTLPHGGRSDRLSDDLTTAQEIIALVLEKGGNPNLQLKLFPPYRALGADRGADGLLRTGTTALFRATRGADIPTMKLLLEHNALVNLSQENGVSPLIVSSGYRASAIDTRGRFRTEIQALEATKLLLAYDADVESRTEGGQTALFGAATNGWNEMVKLLIEYGADVTATDDQGNTVVDAAMGRAGRFGRGAGGDQHLETAAMLEQMILAQN